MFSLFWSFAGFLTGLLISVVFTPPPRPVPALPTPDDSTPLRTGAGCVKFRSEEVPCKGTETSLNVVASQYK